MFALLSPPVWSWRREEGGGGGMEEEPTPPSPPPPPSKPPISGGSEDGGEFTEDGGREGWVAWGGKFGGRVVWGEPKCGGMEPGGGGGGLLLLLFVLLLLASRRGGLMSNSSSSSSDAGPHSPSVGGNLGVVRNFVKILKIIKIWISCDWI